MTSLHKNQQNPLALYTSNIPSTVSIFEAKNQFYTFIQIGFWGLLFHLYAQNLWSRLVSNYNLQELGFSFSLMLLTGVFIIQGLFFFILDSFPQTFNKYRIQNFRQIKKGDYFKALKTAIFNALVISPIFGYITFQLYRIRTRDVNFSQIPSIQQILFHNALFLIIQEIGFYYSHRLLHHYPYLYKTIHKKHHQFIAPIGISAIYAHPIEHIISNLTPLFLGPLIMKSHILTYWIWLILAITGTMINHSDYALPGFTIPINHDFHHYVQQQNFGVLGILDYIHGTDSQYRKMIGIANEKNNKQKQEIKN